MKKHPVKAEAPQFLSGWKEIGSYLGKGVRTVQRYERELGLPVRRPAGKPRGSVVAVKAEVDGWVNASPIREVFHLRNNAPEYKSTARAITKGLSELAQLREQMVTLRTEVKTSVERLRESVVEVAKGLGTSMWSRSALVSRDERELLDRNNSLMIHLPTKFPKAS